MKRIFATLLLLFTLAAVSLAQSGSASFDRTVHDFGEVKAGDGPLECSFTLTNNGTESINIFAVITTCSCTTVKWTRTDIAPGSTGKIEVSYTNDEGPYPFDKTLKVYISDARKPVLLHVKGVARKR